MKRVCSLLLVLVLLISVLTIPTRAAGQEAIDAANALHIMGLFNGVGTNGDGTPNYDLDRTMTRSEAVTMLVRLLGKEEAATRGTWQIPFVDVAQWAKPYVGYAYENKLTSGTSVNTFSGGDNISATQYLTFVLRALGYTSGEDFQWDKAWELTDQLGITHGEYNERTRFTRGDAVKVSFESLKAKLKGRDQTLIAQLCDNYAVDMDKVQQAGLGAYTGNEVLPKPINVGVEYGKSFAYIFADDSTQTEPTYCTAVYYATSPNGVFTEYCWTSETIYKGIIVSDHLTAGKKYYFKVRNEDFTEDHRQIYSGFSDTFEVQIPASNSVGVSPHIAEYILDQVTLGIEWAEAAMEYCKYAYNVGNVSDGLKYAQEAQNKIRGASACIYQAAGYCSEFSDLQECRGNLLIVYAKLSYYGDTLSVSPNDYKAYASGAFNEISGTIPYLAAASGTLIRAMSGR